MTKFSALRSQIDFQTSSPAEPVAGDFYYDTSSHRVYVYDGSAWYYGAVTTTTSTSTSTTSTSTSSSTSSSTSTSTSTSTTTTL